MPEDAHFDTRKNLKIDGRSATFVDWNSPELDLTLHDYDAELTSTPHVCQINPTVDPADVAQELAKYWETFWNAPSTSENSDSEWEMC